MITSSRSRRKAQAEQPHEGVAALFGVADVKSELVVLGFHAGKFTPVGAATWVTNN